jgi:two-component system phosphate regulon sensor histidine kinase PhoR
MKKLKNTITLALIISSVMLLVALQTFWLRSSYMNELSDLRKQTNLIFRNTVFQLRDSVFFSSLRPYEDSVRQNLNRSNITINGMEITDTVFLKRQASTVQVFLSSSGESDSLINAIKPLTQKLKSMQQRGDQNFTIRIAADSINRDTLLHHFKKNLMEENIAIDADVSEIKFSRMKVNNHTALQFIPPGPRFESSEYHIPFPKQSHFSDTLSIEPVRLNPAKLYAARLTGIRKTIIKKITPQIAFSLFLTLLTTVAFIVMYRSIRNQQRLMQLKNEFISNITHELKTPITTVGVAIEALRNFKGINNPEVTDEYLGIAQNELNRLSILTEKVLRTAIYEDKGVVFKPDPVDLDKITGQVLNSMKLVFDKQDAKVSFEKSGSDFNMMGSTIHLTSVIYNLLDNALKYSLLNPEIKISLKEEGANLILSVKDNGIGIPAEYQKKVFEKFFRVPTGDVHNIKGYGLGLSYVESVVRGHKGTIKVESEPGIGSNFIITFPKEL